MICAGAAAQKTNADIRKGNLLYKQKNYEGSKQAYNKALSENPKDPTANYNLGNADFRSEKHDDAVQLYDNTITNSTDNKPVQEKAYYNKGVAYSKGKKLQESIDAWKASLKLDPNDNDARENLQKALLELKKQQQQQQQQNKDKKDDKKKDQQKQPKEQQQQQPQSKLNKQQVEQLLKALEQKEKEIQQKMQKGTASPNKPDKDW